jgi:hypothetical protein
MAISSASLATIQWHVLVQIRRKPSLGRQGWTEFEQPQPLSHAVRAALKFLERESVSIIFLDKALGSIPLRERDILLLGQRLDYPFR